MTDAELNALEAVARAATPGPWADEHNERLDRHYVNCRNGSKEICECQAWARESINGEGNATFIAAANPAAILELIAELRQARKERDWLADMTTKACNHQNGCPFIFWDCKIEGDSCSNICLTNWLEAAKEATCQK